MTMGGMPSKRDKGTDAVLKALRQFGLAYLGSAFAMALRLIPRRAGLEFAKIHKQNAGAAL
jgi:hypothetical protein